jgi:hypothetical protein
LKSVTSDVDMGTFKCFANLPKHITVLNFITKLTLRALKYMKNFSSRFTPFTSFEETAKFVKFRDVTP